MSLSCETQHFMMLLALHGHLKRLIIVKYDFVCLLVGYHFSF